MWLPKKNISLIIALIHYRVYVSKHKIIDVEFARDVNGSVNNNGGLVGIVNLVQNVAEADKSHVLLLPAIPNTHMHVKYRLHHQTH